MPNLVKLISHRYLVIVPTLCVTAIKLRILYAWSKTTLAVLIHNSFSYCNKTAEAVLLQP